MREDHAADFAGFLQTSHTVDGPNLSRPVATVWKASEIQVQLSS